ncbi:MAG: hypothetical protein FGM23_02410 [Alphaproteobacteria bacterium]|nr:hypothetical protein [Alphaproteobacteria bacterium]
MTMIPPTALAVLWRAALLVLLLATVPTSSWATDHSNTMGNHAEHSEHDSHAAHQNHANPAASPHETSPIEAADTISLELVDAPQLEPGKAVTVRFRLRRQADGKALSFKDLKEVHTKKLHLFVNDSSLTDFFHLHPQPTAKDATLFTFRFTPNKPGNYQLWADITPLAKGAQRPAQQQFLPASLAGVSPAPNPIDTTLVDEATLGSLKAKLSFDPPLQSDKASIGTVTVTNLVGQPIHNLEPVLGAFAHVVAYANNGQSVLHSHPMGKEPKGAADRAGPTLQFHLAPGQSGFIKIFVQIRLDGRDLILPFGVTVQDKAKD